MEGALGGLVLSAIGAATVVVAAWLQFPRGQEPRPGTAATVFAATIGGMLPFGLLVILVAAPVAALPLPAVGLAFVHAFALAALPEEAFKGAVIWLVAFRRGQVRRVQDGAFYGVVAGAAFGLLENVAYIVTAEHAAGLGEQVAFIRTAVSAPGHAAEAAIVGHHLALAARVGGTAGRRLVLRGVAIAVAFHGAFDFVLMAGEALHVAWLGFLALPIFMAAVVTAFVFMERARRPPSPQG